MRLLRSGSLGKLSLTKDYVDDAPPYVIVSYRFLLSIEKFGMQIMRCILINRLLLSPARIDVNFSTVVETSGTLRAL
jgi:hypothetical protein